MIKSLKAFSKTEYLLKSGFYQNISSHQKLKIQAENCESQSNAVSSEIINLSLIIFNNVIRT